MNTQAESMFNRRDFLKAAGAGTAAVSLTGSVSTRAGEKETLPTRLLGNTGVRVPIIGVGTAPAGFRGRKQAAAVYHECLDLGITYVDTAPEFAGYGKAQVALGDVLKTRRDEAFVVTKCWEPDGEKALALLKKNLRELQTDRADVVYAHSLGADNMDPKVILGANGVLPALAKAQKDGLVRFIGVSGHNRPARFLQVIREFEIQVMMNAVSFVARHIYDFETTVWPEAHKRGIALVAMKVFGGAPGGPKEPKQARVADGDLLGAFRYAQSLPNISTVVLGIHDREQLHQIITWAKSFRRLDEREMTELLAHGKTLSEKWGSCYGPVV